MNCDQVKEWFPHYIDGLLSLDKELIIQLHLKSCPGCEQDLEEARELSALWEDMTKNMGLPDDGYIPDLTAAVLAEIEHFEAGRSKAVRSPATSRRRYAPRTSWMHYGLAACMTFLLFQFGVFEGLAYQITEINGQMSSSVISWFGPQSNPSIHK